MIDFSKFSLFQQNLEKTAGIYKVEIFTGMFEKQRKDMRRRLRKMSEGYVQMILKASESKNEKHLKDVCTEFFEFYTTMYANTNFKVATFSNSNNSEYLAFCQKALDIVKTTLKK